MKMKKTVLRLYNKNDEYSLKGDRYFLVLNGSYDDLDDFEFIKILQCLSILRWQNYTSFLVAEVELKKSEMYWCEALNYKMHECCINVDRLQNVKKYKLPEMFCG